MSLVFAGGKIQSVLCLRSQLAGEGAQGEGGGGRDYGGALHYPPRLHQRLHCRSNTGQI